MPRRPIAKTLKYVDQFSIDKVLSQCDDGCIGQVLESKGRDIHLIKLANGGETLVTLLPKLRGIVWLRKGSFVFVQLYGKADLEHQSKPKINGEILHVFTLEQIESFRQGKDHAKYSEQVNVFDKSNNFQSQALGVDESADVFSDSSLDIPGNPNHYYSSDSDS